ncbi:hypothetical protein ZWY2020_016885 [Hordeum vulgare]|nr:hypothetical protein ZWY2020_016885 [Hordeum vulgare]
MARMKIPKRYVIVLLTFICTNASADAINVNQANKGLILSMFYYGYVLSQIPGGWAAQRLGGDGSAAVIPVVVFDMRSNSTGPQQSSHSGPFSPFCWCSTRFHISCHSHSPGTMGATAGAPRSVSLTTSGMYLGAACGMLFFPSLVKHMGPQSVCLVEAVLGVAWSVIWLKFSSEPPRTDLPKVAIPKLASLEKIKSKSIPWLRIIFSLPVWAIVVNNFTFHYALYVIMNWLPTYFNYCCTHGPSFIRDASGTVICLSVSLGFLALGRAGFAVNHMDVAPKFAGIVMGVSNTAGTLADIFFVPAYLCIFSSVIFLVFSTGEKIFE